jgi:hypothetical protein
MFDLLLGEPKWLAVSDAAHLGKQVREGAVSESQIGCH